MCVCVCGVPRVVYLCNDRLIVCKYMYTLPMLIERLTFAGAFTIARFPYSVFTLILKALAKASVMCSIK